MRFCIALVSALVLLNVAAFSQSVPVPSPTPTPNSRNSSVNPITSDNSGYDRLRSIELMNDRARVGSHPLLDSKKGIYRRPGKSETEVLAVAEPLRAKYAAYLKQPDTGIVKLNAESSCVSEADVVNASEKCLAFKMPGAGAAYSFRTESYRLPRLADIILIDGVFKTGGVLQQVVIAEIGDVKIENVTLTSPGIKFLADLEPVRDGQEFMKMEEKLRVGIKADGFSYRRGQFVKDNATYVLRSIAYRGEFVRTIEGMEYNELDYDKRRDVIVAFRVVDRDPSGNVTIIWKSLKDVEAPKLKTK